MSQSAPKILAPLFQTTELDDLNMSAYHNPDWAECYDLWVRLIFGDGPVEDLAVFEDILRDIINAQPLDSYISVVDVGTGSGRVLLSLQDIFQKNLKRHFEVWGLEPSSPMLDRAKRFWSEAIDKRKRDSEAHWDEARVRDHWVQCGAADFAGQVLEEDHCDGMDLVIFAAGGVCHVITNQEILKFLAGVKKTLKSGGKAVISILRDFIPSSPADTNFKSQDYEISIAKGKKPQIIFSMDHPGLVYVKHPTTESVEGNVKTEKFRLDVEDEEGNVLRTHELSWDERMFDKDFWESCIKETGLKVGEVREGAIQIWYVLEHA